MKVIIIGGGQVGGYIASLLLENGNSVAVIENKGKALQALEKTEMLLKDWNIVSRERLLGHPDVIVKIRYRKQENHCTVTITPDNLLHVQLHEPLTAIASGQAAAFYKDGLLLGGGIITEALSATHQLHQQKE